MAQHHGAHEAPQRELIPGVTRRAAALVIGVLLLQFGFVLSSVGAFHAPTPRDVPLAVVAPTGAPAGTAASVVDRLPRPPPPPPPAPGAPGGAAGSDDAARRLLADREMDGVLLLGADGADTLLVAGAEGGAVSSALGEVLTQVDNAQQRTLTTTDAIPAAAGDARGLSAFYLAIGWVVGGYLVAAIIGVSAGSRPSTRARGAVRLGALAVYSVVSGIGGALITGPVLGVFDGHLLALAAFGALLVFAVGAVTMALQVWTGLIGLGLAILLFVILGNPSAGGAYPAPLLPPFWAGIAPWLPPGAATDAVRGIVYLRGGRAGASGLVLIAYAVVGFVAVLQGPVASLRAMGGSTVL